LTFFSKSKNTNKSTYVSFHLSWKQFADTNKIEITSEREDENETKGKRKRMVSLENATKTTY
jgi:hypothetical protein